MGSSLSTLRTWVGDLLQDTSFRHYGGDSTDANRAINHAIKFVASQAPWELLGTLRGYTTGTTTSGTAEVALPTDYFQIRKVKYSNDGTTFYWAEQYTIDQIDVVEKNIFHDGAAANPKWWLGGTTSGAYLTLDPTPAATGSYVYFYYVKLASTLSNDSDTSPLNSLLDYAVCLWACNIMAATVPDYEDSKKWIELFGQEMGTIGGKGEA